MKTEQMYTSRDGGEIHFWERESAEQRAKALATEYPEISFRVEAETKESEFRGRTVFRIYYVM